MEEKKLRRRQAAIVEIDAAEEMSRVNGADQLCRLMDSAPVRGVSRHIISGGHVDLLSHVIWLLRVYSRIDSLFMSAWAFSANDIMMLKRWLESGQITTAGIICGDVYPERYRMEWKLLCEMKDTGLLQRLYSEKIHSKFILAACGSDRIVIESSANCNMNPRVEQSVVTNSAELYEFYCEYYDDLFFDKKIKTAAKKMSNLKIDTKW